MATINDIMTREVSVIQLSDPLQIAAQRMRDLGIGTLPVRDGETPVGMVTNRDIAVRGVAAGLRPADALVCDVMSDEMLASNPTDDALREISESATLA